MTSIDTQGGLPPGRATTFDTFLAKLGSMNTREGVEKGLGMTLLSTDIVVAPFGKSGTTWLQQMAHTLRTRGDMDFDDISRVVPWIELSTNLGLDLDAPQKADPRVFKSHLDAHRMPVGGRYIIACRDPKDAAYSLFKFMEGWFFEPGTIPLDDFLRETFIASGKSPASANGDYWTHLTSWWHRREDPDVLFMAYEHMKEDLLGTIRKVAAFMDIALDDELMAITEEHASLQFMQKHKNRFDDKLMRERSVEVAGLPGDSESSKVRVGQIGESRQRLGADVSLALDDLWRERITKDLGFEDYASMIATLQ